MHKKVSRRRDHRRGDAAHEHAHAASVSVLFLNNTYPPIYILVRHPMLRHAGFDPSQTIYHLMLKWIHRFSLSFSSPEIHLPGNF